MIFIDVNLLSQSHFRFHCFRSKKTLSLDGFFIFIFNRTLVVAFATPDKFESKHKQCLPNKCLGKIPKSKTSSRIGERLSEEKRSRVEQGIDLILIASPDSTVLVVIEENPVTTAMIYK
jgi:hypothetical protein